MSTFDHLIEQLAQTGAERLVLVSGKPPVLTVDGQHVPVGDAVDRDAVEGMALAMGDEGGHGQRRFRYEAHGGAFEATARIAERVAQLIVVPVEAPEGHGPEGGAETGSDAAAHAPSREPEPAEPTRSEPPRSEPTPPGPTPAEPRPSEPTLPEPPPSEPSLPEPPSHVFEVREDAPAMERLFVKMVENGCSDLHISAGSAPLFRKDGRITDLGSEPGLSPRDTEALLMGITPERYRKEFEERNDTDFAYEIPNVARFRCNLFRDRKGIGGVFRQIPTEILTVKDLGLDPRLVELCQLKKGLILVTGPTGSGKSTTLAALIDHINRTREDHIITIEDPIEFVHENRSCLINQREVGEHTESFKVALRAALREDPDIVLVGELRDLETVEIALETAETGHLVFGTLHTNTAPGTVSRLIDQFPSGQQAQIRTMLADTLKAVIAQTLCRKKGGGRIAALEVLVVNSAVANLIREDKAYQIPSTMQTGKAQGMNTLNDSLLDLVQRSVVTPEEAYWNAVDKAEFATLLERNGIDIEEARRDVA
ncbi:MAG: PilT/PilU family type 4a pilus ATPase [Gemmatimonadota bacterium]|nr:PilT/PilU family type 4a pilus ATPase [Gemmatimonadota bacterium]